MSLSKEISVPMSDQAYSPHKKASSREEEWAGAPSLSAWSWWFRECGGSLAPPESANAEKMA